MDERLVKILRCPKCQSSMKPLASKRTKIEPSEDGLRCGICRRDYATMRGIPRLVPKLSRKVGQVQNSYSFKWTSGAEYFYGKKLVFMREWYLRRYHWKSEEEFAKFVRGKRLVLDAGCGQGRDVDWYASLGAGFVVGVDLSEAVQVAAERVKGLPNARIIQGDILRLPFDDDTFDFVACDQVIPCVADQQTAVDSLARVAKPGSHLALYFYRKKAPMREFADDYLRNIFSKLSPEECWEAMKRFTDFGKALSEAKITIDVPVDIPELEIKKGRYDLQRFIYYKFFKCFWNEDFEYEGSNSVNFDWYHPAYTYRVDRGQVEGFLKKAKLETVLIDEEDSAISVLARKPS